MLRFIASLLLLCMFSGFAEARYDDIYNVFVAPVAGNWDILPGDSPDFVVTVLESGLPAEGTVKYTVKNDLSDENLTGILQLVDGKCVIKGIAPAAPCFEQCSVTYTAPSGATAKGMGTLAFRPADIEAVVEDPTDFDSFWTKTLEQIPTPADIELEALPDKSTKTIDVYRMSFTAGNAGRFYGMLAVPKGKEKLPAVVQ